ncbi:MAG: hypothetical protein WAN05_05235, partial [Roseiarcus sp.]
MEQAPAGRGDLLTKSGIGDTHIPINRTSSRRRRWPLDERLQELFENLAGAQPSREGAQREKLFY